MGIISPINTLAMIFYVCIERVMSHKHEIPSGASVRGEGGEAGEWKLVMPNFYSWGKCIMLLTNRLCLLTLRVKLLNSNAALTSYEHHGVHLCSSKQHFKEISHKTVC